MQRTALPTRLALVVSVLVCVGASRADVTDPTPYDYDHPPRAGKEGGTYAITIAGSAGADCMAVVIGTAKFLPNRAGTGGMVCAKLSVELRGAGPTCALAPMAESGLITVGGPYTLNGDGTVCENLHFIGGLLDGMPDTIHSYFDPRGKGFLFSGQDIAYPCPGLPPSTPPHPVILSGRGIRISRHGDEPPGSGMLPCANP
jgi:hypothetical protein